MCASRRGFTLIEVVVLIVNIGIATAGVLLIFQNTVRKSADPQIYKQSLAIAEAMLDEILLNPYQNDGATAGRQNFNEVSDYAGYSTGSAGMKNITDVLVPGLGDYNVTVAVASTPLNDSGNTLTAIGESKKVTVTVTHVSGLSLSLDGYRLNYAGP